ncbi:hypothetical protein PC128_g15505 [Phytophthora cactorum]|nr:hypothetical protein PC128_g15505 [Phytophthora cactorum]
MASVLHEEDDKTVPLDLLEVETLPPLSPTMQRAFFEAIADEEGDESVSLCQSEASPVQWTSPSELSSPSLEAMTAEWQEELTTMSPSETKAGDSLEAKRARRSAIEKKSRQRRQNVLRRMRQEVKQLENVYTEMAKRQEGTSGTLAPNNGTLQHKYSQLSLVTQALENDRVKMLKLLENHEVFQRTAEAMAKRGASRREALANLNHKEDLVWDTGVPPSSSFAVQIRQRSPAECYELVRETYETIKRFDDGGHFVSTGANFMGWTDKRKYDESQALQYGFAKTFPLESAEKLLMQTWNVFCHADTMAHLSFNASVITRFEIVQTLGDDLCIIRRDHKFPHLPLNFVTVHIVFRLQTPTGYTMCMRTIPTPELKDALEPHEHYYDVFHWTHFNHAFDEDGLPAGCEISTGGYIADVKQLVSKYWLFELVMSVLRWENMCVAPLFLNPLIVGTCPQLVFHPITGRCVHPSPPPPASDDAIRKTQIRYSPMELVTPQSQLLEHEVDNILGLSEPNGRSTGETHKPAKKRSGAKVKSADANANANAAQRARRSEIEKKSRQRRQGSIKVMRAEIKVLEREYLRLASRAAKASSDATTSEEDAIDNDQHERGILLDPTQVQALRNKFLRLLSEAAALRKEQKQLHKILNVQQLFRDSFQALAAEFAGSDRDPRLNAVYHAHFEPLATETCFAIMRDSYDVITRFEAGQDFVTTGSSLFGWSDRRRLDDDESKMIFCFRKMFENQSCERLMEESWRTFSDLEFMRRVVFSSKVGLDLEILQVVNRDALVVRRHTNYRAMGRSFHTVYLLFRLQTANGYTVCFRTIPAPGIQQALGEGEAWIDLFHWTTLSRVPDADGMLTGCEISFGGSIGAGVMNFAAHWMLELIMTVVRWENACVAPLFIK